MKKQPIFLAIAALTAVLSACSQPLSSGSDTSSDGSDTAAVARPDVALGDVALPQSRNLQPLPRLSGPAIQLPVRSQDLSPNASIVGLKVLVIGTGASDINLAPATSMLDNAGVPYDVLDATTTDLTSATLINADGSGKYEGVLLTTGGLSYQTPSGGYDSALNYTEWSTLWGYERDYAVRQLAMYVYPSTYPEDYGLRPVNDGSGSDFTLNTTAGTVSVFNDFKPGASIPVKYSYAYPASVAPEDAATTVPLLTDSAGNVMAATSTSSDGRERLALTFAQNQYFVDTELMGYGLVNWLTKGVYLGDYRRYNQLDSDDWFLNGDVFNVNTKGIDEDVFRLSANDAFKLRDGQTELQTRFPVSADFRYAVMFNGGGAKLRAPKNCNPTNTTGPDPLTGATRCLGDAFDWVSHTFDHLYMDKLSFAKSYGQLNPNIVLGKTVGLQMSVHSLVSGDFSGLGWYNPNGDGVKTDYGLQASNPNFLKAAQAAGIAYIASNRSVSSHYDHTCLSCGLIHPLNKNIFLVPRWPVNLFYDATTPQQATVAYNSVYGPSGTAPYWDHDLSYSEFLDKESDVALSHVLSGEAFPHFIHTDNFYNYDTSTKRSLAYDWEEALLTKYSNYTTLPLRTLRWDDLGPFVKAHTSYMKSGASGSWNRLTHQVTVNSPVSASVFVTGAVGGSTSTYFGKPISQLSLGASQTSTLTVP